MTYEEALEKVNEMLKKNGNLNEMAETFGCYCQEDGQCPGFSKVGFVGSNATNCRYSNSVGDYGCPLLRDM